MKNKISVKARKLLLRVKAHILEEPLRLRMGEFIRIQAEDGSAYASETDGFGQEGSSSEIQYPACGTVGCIAGWMDLLSNGMPTTARAAISRAAGAEAFAAKVLGCPDNEVEKPNHAGGLFYRHGWRPALIARYDKALTPKTRAKIVGEVIDEYLKAH
jgi:hypothetical protein